MPPSEYLGGMPEQTPPWLNEFQIGDAFPREPFFASRIVYYPGSGTDGHPVKLFGSSQSAHCFVYADYGITQDAVEAELRDPDHGFHGYHSLARLHLAEANLTPNGWVPHVPPGYMAPRGQGHVGADPYGFLEVLERDQELDDNHGARRLAILFLGADGIATYDALFCQGHGTPPPFAVVVQDHGFGGNYDRFGEGGLLAHIVRECDAVPPWLLVGEDTDPWQGFVRVPGVEEDRGEMHHTPRSLFQRCDGQVAAASQSMK